MQSDYRLSFVLGLVGMVLGLAAFTFNYYLTPTSLPGYDIIALPAMFALSFFSEEMPFTPKMIIFMTGQFIGYSLTALIFRKITKKLRTL